MTHYVRVVYAYLMSLYAVIIAFFRSRFSPSTGSASSAGSRSLVSKSITLASGRCVRVTELIAEGGFSFVYKGSLNDGKTVAVKQVPTFEDTHAVDKEIQVMRALKTVPGIVPLLDR